MRFTQYIRRVSVSSEKPYIMILRDQKISAKYHNQKGVKKTYVVYNGN